MPIHRDRLNMTDRFLKTARRVKLKSRMLEICKSGSVRGIEVFSYGLNIVTLRKPKGRSNREYKINLKEKTILCLLDVKREVRRQESGDRMGQNTGKDIMQDRCPKWVRSEKSGKTKNIMFNGSLLARSGCPK